MIHPRFPPLKIQSHKWRKGELAAGKAGGCDFLLSPWFGQGQRVMSTVDRERTNRLERPPLLGGSLWLCPRRWRGLDPGRGCGRRGCDCGLQPSAHREDGGESPPRSMQKTVNLETCNMFSRHRTKPNVCSNRNFHMLYNL